MNPVSNIGGTSGTFQSISLQEKRSCSSSSITSSNKLSRTSSPSGTVSPATTNEAGSKPDTPITVSLVDGNINEGLNGLHFLSDAATGQLVGNGIAADVDSSQNKKSDVTASDSGSEDGLTSSTKFVLTLDKFRKNVDELKKRFDAGIKVENNADIQSFFDDLNVLYSRLDKDSKTMNEEFNQLLDDVFGYFTEKACKVNLNYFFPEKILTNIARYSKNYSKQDHLLEIIFSVVTKQLDQPLSKDCKDSLNAFLDSFLTQGERDLSEFLESKKSKGPEGNFYVFDGPDLKCALTAFVQTIDHSTSLFTMESRVTKYVHEMLHPEDYDNSKKRKPLSPNQRALYLFLDKFTNCKHVRLLKDGKLKVYENKQHDLIDFKPSFEDLN